MTFPVRIGFGAWSLPPHPVFELLAFAVALALLRRARRQDPLAAAQRSTVLIGGLAGALLGAKGLVLLEHRALVAGDPRQALALLLMGKTVVGALLGGLVGVELTKAAIGLRRSTGDLFVLPLLAGIAIGRIGCFLTGLDDHTHGLPTTLPWGVDFGDGIPRHPTQLYEIGFLLLLALALRFGSRRTWPEGRRFQLFLGAYLAFRLGVDALKPTQPLAAGLGAIQWAALLGLIWCLVAALADSRRRS
jgi:phosphatidylglycerol:prolipoprotein diacylglycerol transferase